MKKLFLSAIITFIVVSTWGQVVNNADKGVALKYIAENKSAIGINDNDLNNLVISSTYTDQSTGITMIYLQQTFKGIPVFNQMLVVAFKEGKLISNTGKMMNQLENLTQGRSEVPSLTAENAVKQAFLEQKLSAPIVIAKSRTEAGRKVDFGKPSGVTEDVTAELFWFPIENGNELSVKLGWQIQVAPEKTDDVWHIRVDASTGKIIDKINVVIFESFEAKHSDHSMNIGQSDFKHQTNFDNKNKNNNIPPRTNLVGTANYLVIPYPYEAPSFSPAAIRTNPWNDAPGNATSLGWHNDGVSDYTTSRGNNVWASEDTIGSNLNTGLPATSTTSPDPLNFVFTPNYNVEPSRNLTMQQFCITNLFYWNNVTHNITYQYGFNELAGNYQQNNQGRGGAGNDYVMALAQSGAAGHIGNNANFLPTNDGTKGRMRMYLFDSVANTSLIVNSPGAISGSYLAIESNFSTANKLINVGPVTGQVVYYNDDAGGTTHYACGAPVNSVAGKIALIDRGFGGAVCTATVPFVDKVKNAQTAGAIAVIMVNNVTGNPIIMGGADNTITIPAVMISQNDGAVFAAQLNNNVNVTLSGTQTSALDGDLDAGIIVHEYTHGISNRLTGGPNTASCLQNAERGGEGWSDYYALMLTTDWNNVNVGSGSIPRPVGTYVIGQSNSGSGIRNYPYTTNMALNPLTYAHMGVNGAPWLFSTGVEVHNIGEIWCAALWEMTWAIIQQENNINTNLYNFSLGNNGGNSIALKLVMEGMKLQPCSPGYIDARNAILTADMNLYGGRHQCAIWTAFAKRGMGYSALQGSSGSATDQTAAFDLPPAPSITTQPMDLTVNPGDNASFIVVSPAPSNGAYKLYKWQVSTNGGATWNDLVPAETGATLNLISVVPAMNGNKYRCIITQGCNTTTSSVATLTVFLPNGFTFNNPAPATATCPAPASMDIVLGTTSVGGFTNPITVSSTPPPAGTTVSFIPSNTVTPGNSVTVRLNSTNTLIAGSYTLTITGVASGATNQTRDIVYTINPGVGPTISSQPAPQTLCEGGNANFTITSAGATAFQWQVSTNGGSTWTNINGAMAASYTITGVTAVMNNNLYRCVASTLCGTTNSNSALLTVQTAPSITAHPQSANLCTGGNALFTVTATGSNLTYQWQLSTSGCSGPWSNIAGATSNSYTFTGVSSGNDNTGYRCIISGTCSPTVTSNCALLTVVTSVSVTSQPVNSTICDGANTSFTVAGSGGGVIYQWQVNTGSGFTNITNGGVYSGATAAMLNITGATPAMNGYQYRCQLTNASCSTPGVSNAATLTVNTLPAVSTNPVNQTICSGGNTSFNIAGSGTGIAYQWQVNTGSGFTNIANGGVYAGATTNTLTITGATVGMNSYQYRCVVTGTCSPVANSSAATLTVYAPVVITSSPSNNEKCSGANATFTVTGTSVPAIIYQWQVSTNGGSTWTNISGATASSYTVSNVSVALNNNQYRCLLSSATCSSPVTSAAGALTVRQLPTVGLTASPLTTLLPGQTTTLTATPTSSTGGTLSVTWTQNSAPITVSGNTLPVTVANLGMYQVGIQETWPSSLACSNLSQSQTIDASASSKLFIFPSPNDGNFTVSYYNSSSSSTQTQLLIYDSKGGLVFDKKFPISGPYTLIPVNLEKASTGIYVVVIGDASGKKLAEGKVHVR